MKNLILLLGFLVGPLAAHASFSLDDGRYYNHANAKKVKINCKSNSIKVKGLINYDWTKFRHCGRREYVDRRGNTIRIVGRNTFEFRARGRNRVMVFHRDHWINQLEHRILNDRCGSSCSANCTIHGSPYDDHLDHGHGGYVDNRGLEGVWATSKYDNDVIIEYTNEGLRAKILGSNRDWTYYRQDSYDKKEYYDNRGNRYVVRTAREIVWYPKQGGSPIVLRRLR